MVAVLSGHGDKVVTGSAGTGNPEPLLKPRLTQPCVSTLVSACHNDKVAISGSGSGSLEGSGPPCSVVAASQWRPTPERWIRTAIGCSPDAVDKIR
eukprot:scaffold19779_cov62-Phaeocystis_antarctica.AAC.2